VKLWVTALSLLADLLVGQSPDRPASPDGDKVERPTGRTTFAPSGEAGSPCGARRGDPGRHLSPPDDVLVLVLAYGGLRIGEALCLRRRHVDLADGRMTVAESVAQLPGGPVIDTPKSHQRRELALPAVVVDRLRQHLAELPQDSDAFLFPGRQQRTAGRPQSYNGWKYRLDRAVERAGLTDLIPHDLRATHGSWVADSHGVLVAARRLGHSNASVTTRHYARAVDGRDAEVAAFLNRARRPGDASEGARNGHAGESAQAGETKKRP
jgi:integrase